MPILSPQGRLSKNGANTEEAGSETNTERQGQSLRPDFKYICKPHFLSLCVFLLICLLITFSFLPPVLLFFFFFWSMLVCVGFSMVYSRKSPAIGCEMLALLAHSEF